MDSKNFLIQWIRHFSQPNSDIESELHRIHGNSINSFVKAIKKAQEQYVPTTPPEAQFPTLDGTVQLLNSIGRIAIENRNELGSPLPAPQFIEDESFSGRIHNYSKRIGEYFAQLRNLNEFGRLRIRVLIWLDLEQIQYNFVLNNQSEKAFLDYIKRHFNLNRSDFNFYKRFARFMEEFPLFYYSGLGWIRLRNECGMISDYLHSSNAMALEPQNMASYMFWKEAPPRYREHEFSPTSKSSTPTDIQWPDIGTGDDMGPSSMIELDSLDSIARLNLNE